MKFMIYEREFKKKEEPFSIKNELMLSVVYLRLGLRFETKIFLKIPSIKDEVFSIFP